MPGLGQAGIYLQVVVSGYRRKYSVRWQPCEKTRPMPNCAPAGAASALSNTPRSPPCLSRALARTSGKHMFLRLLWPCVPYLAQKWHVTACEWLFWIVTVEHAFIPDGQSRGIFSSIAVLVVLTAQTSKASK